MTIIIIIIVVGIALTSDDDTRWGGVSTTMRNGWIVAILFIVAETRKRRIGRRRGRLLRNEGSEKRTVRFSLLFCEILFTRIEKRKSKQMRC